MLSPHALGQAGLRCGRAGRGCGVWGVIVGFCHPWGTWHGLFPGHNPLAYPQAFPSREVTPHPSVTVLQCEVQLAPCPSSMSQTPVGHTGTQCLSARTAAGPLCPLRAKGCCCQPRQTCRGSGLLFAGENISVSRGEDQRGITHRLLRCQGTPRSCYQQTLSFICQRARINQGCSSPTPVLG